MWDLKGGNSDLEDQSTWFIDIDLECLYCFFANTIATDQTKIAGKLLHMT
jgi:hypothetical protein